jgi:putative pyruvate formate lyase activating enzyme
MENENISICNLCPRGCKVDRDKKIGFCESSNKVRIALYNLFMWEEPCISGTKGSGAIFFSGCSLRCCFCQNFEISNENKGKEITIEELANIFKELENMGAHNINLVNPTHYVKQIIEALKIYRPNIPIVYNTHGYETIETINLVAPYVDIFLPDLKYITPAYSLKYSSSSDYFDFTSKAIKRMIELKPNIFDENDMMKQGVIIRHLILPTMTNESIKILNYIATTYPKGTLVSLMSQYVPCYKAKLHPEINRQITKREYEKVLNVMCDLDLDGYVQDLTSATKDFIPKWNV